MPSPVGRVGHARHPYPETWPAYDDLRFDARGRLWVRRSVHAADSIVPWDVFTREGVYLGDVAFPRKLGVKFIDEHAVYGFVRDEIDVSYVVRMRIERPGSQ